MVWDFFEWLNTNQGQSRDSLQAVSDILVRSGDFLSDPLEGNPYLLLNSKVLNGLGDIPDLEPVSRAQHSVTFPAFSNELWSALPITGTLLDEPINFGSGQADLNDDSQEQLREAVRRPAYYPGKRIMVTAQVSPGTDPEQDLALSNGRARVVRDFLIIQGVAPERIHSEGLGSQNLPARLMDESDASWKRRCRHARILLMGGQT